MHAPFLCLLACEVGSYRSDSDSTCQRCPHNTIQTGVGVCECPCLPGFYRADGEGAGTGCTRKLYLCNLYSWWVDQRSRCASIPYVASLVVDVALHVQCHINHKGVLVRGSQSNKQTYSHRQYSTNHKHKHADNQLHKQHNTVYKASQAKTSTVYISIAWDFTLSCENFPQPT